MDAGWDEELLRVEIESLQGADFDVALTGFDEKDIAELFAGDDGDTQEDDFDVDGELKKPPVSKDGDVWLLGKHRLVCGDSTKEETYVTLMDGKKANLVVTDPPYNVNYEGGAGKIKNDNMENDKFYQFLLDAFTNMGYTVVPFGQGFKDMSPPTKELMKLTLEQRLAHSGHPVLRWMMDNIFIRTDPAGNIKADKEKSTEKIDGAIATIMALDRAIRCGNDNGASVYDERGILFV